MCLKAAASQVVIRVVVGGEVQRLYCLVDVFFEARDPKSTRKHYGLSRCIHCPHVYIRWWPQSKNGVPTFFLTTFASPSIKTMQLPERRGVKFTGEKAVKAGNSTL